jgi:outer membrane protein TolC
MPALALVFLLIPIPSFASKIDPLFQRFRERTEQQSPDVRIAEAISAEKSYARYTAWTRWMPRVDLQLGQSRGKDYSLISSGALGSVLGNTEPSTLTLMRMGLQLSVPIYQRSVHLNVESANEQAELSQIGLESARSEVRWKLRHYFGEYLLELYRGAALVSSIELAESNLKEAKLRFELGQKTRVDVLKAESNLSQLESRKFTHEQALARAMGDMLEYSGVSHEEFKTFGFTPLLASEDALASAIEEFTVTPTFDKRLEPWLGSDLETAKKSWDRVTRESPVYLRITTEERQANAQSRQAMSGEFPELLLQGSITKQAQGWGRAFESDQRSTSIALVLNIPLFSGGSTFSTYFEQKNGLAANLYRRERELLKLRHELEEQRLQIVALKKQISSQRLALAKNREIVKLSLSSYRLGKATITEVLLNQTELLDSKINLAHSMLQHATLMHRYAWNLGVAVP